MRAGANSDETSNIFGVNRGENSSTSRRVLQMDSTGTSSGHFRPNVSTTNNEPSEELLLPPQDNSVKSVIMSQLTDSFRKRIVAPSDTLSQTINPSNNLSSVNAPKRVSRNNSQSNNARKPDIIITERSMQSQIAPDVVFTQPVPKLKPLKREMMTPHQKVGLASQGGSTGEEPFSVSVLTSRSAIPAQRPTVSKVSNVRPVVSPKTLRAGSSVQPSTTLSRNENIQQTKRGMMVPHQKVRLASQGRSTREKPFSASVLASRSIIPSQRPTVSRVLNVRPVVSSPRTLRAVQPSTISSTIRNENIQQSDVSSNKFIPSSTLSQRKIDQSATQNDVTQSVPNESQKQSLYFVLQPRVMSDTSDGSRKSIKTKTGLASLVLSTMFPLTVNRIIKRSSATINEPPPTGTTRQYYFICSLILLIFICNL